MSPGRLAVLAIVLALLALVINSIVLTIIAVCLAASVHRPTPGGKGV